MRSFKLWHLSILVIIVALTSCGSSNQGADPYKGELTKSDLVSNKDLEGTRMTVIGTDLPTINWEPRTISPVAFKRYVEMRIVPNGNSLVQDVSGSDQLVYSVAVHEKIDFTDWVMTGYPKFCKEITFKSNGKITSVMSPALVESDIISECAESRVTTAQFEVNDSTIPRQSVLYADCALEDSGIFLEVTVGDLNPGILKQAQMSAVDLLKRQLVKLK